MSHLDSRKLKCFSFLLHTDQLTGGCCFVSLFVSLESHKVAWSTFAKQAAPDETIVDQGWEEKKIVSACEKRQSGHFFIRWESETQESVHYDSIESFWYYKLLDVSLWKVLWRREKK